MDQPVSTHAQKVVPNHKIGLNSDRIDEMNINFAVYTYLSKKKTDAPPPKRTVGQATTLRKRILQLSLFPDIYDKRANLRSPGNVDFGDPHAIKG
jgi:hypothetical protein